MTIAFGAIGAKSAGGTTTINVAYPSSVGAGDLLVTGRVSWNAMTHTAESGWTLQSNTSSGTGTAADAHTTRVSADTRVADGGETGSVTFDQGGTASGALGVMLRYTKDPAKSWHIQGSLVGSDATHGADRSVTPANQFSMEPGDVIVAIVAVDTDAALTITSPTFTATGFTFGTPQRRTSGAGVTTGNDGNVEVFDIEVLTGSGSAAGTFAFTTATSQCGGVAFVRLREVVPFVLHPTSDASSPATIKTTAAGAQTTDAFTCPANACIVVGLTSDADSNAGNPTITDNTGGKFTWTRVAAIGANGVGDVGMAALWQGVPTNPGTAPGSMTVTVTPNNTGSNKPKMIRTSVYPDTEVDISDPIGHVVTGSFGANITSVSATITPETTGGGIRMMWLDWNATGVPTTLQANTDVVDFYHNAGLSTNIQLGKSTETVTGVNQTIGANFLSATSDGNWIAYELRAPSGASAINAGPTAIATGEAFGTMSVNAIRNTNPTGVATAAAFGTQVANVITGTVPTAISTGAAFGSHTVTIIPPATTLTPTGIATAAVLGTHSALGLLTVVPTAIGSALAFGAVSALGKLTSVPTAIATAEAFGAPTVAVIPPVLTLTPSGVASAEALGAPTIATLLTASPSGVASALAFGSLTALGVLGVLPSGIASAQALGTHVVVIIPPSVTATPAAISSAAALGSHAVSTLLGVVPTAIPTALAFGALSVTTGIAMIPTGIASAVALGNPAVSTVLTSTPSGITSGLAMGTPSVLVILSAQPGSIATAEAFGGPSVLGKLSVVPAGIIGGEAFGNATATVFGGLITASPVGIGTAEATGQPSALSRLTVAPVGITSALAFGTLAAKHVRTVTPDAVSSALAFGTPVVTGQVYVTPAGIVSGAAFGSMSVLQVLAAHPTGIASGEALGSPSSSTQLLVVPVGIDSAEAFGTIILTVGSDGISGAIEPVASFVTLDGGSGLWVVEFGSAKFLTNGGDAWFGSDGDEARVD